MPDWRFVTQINSTVSVSSPPTTRGMWVDLDGVDTIMQMDGRSHGGAHSRLGWLSGGMWHYIFVAEQVAPTLSDEQQPTTHERTSNADSALESSDQP